MPKPAVADQRLSRQFYQRLHKYIKSRIADSQDAEDITQEVFVRLSERIQNIDASKLIPWIFTTARNMVTDYYRRKARHPEKIPMDDSVSSTQTGEKGQLVDCLEPLLSQLSPNDQVLLRRIDMQGQSQKGYAANMNIPYPTLKSQVQRARVKLRQLLIQCCKSQEEMKGPCC